MFHILRSGCREKCVPLRPTYHKTIYHEVAILCYDERNYLLIVETLTMSYIIVGVTRGSDYCGSPPTAIDERNRFWGSNPWRWNGHRSRLASHSGFQLGQFVREAKVRGGIGIGHQLLQHIVIHPCKFFCPPSLHAILAIRTSKSDHRLRNQQICKIPLIIL